MTVDRTILQERLIAILHRFPQRNVLVVGDVIADQFVYGSISRTSREAPVFILRHERTETVPGGAANCALNLASLGARVSLIGIRGTDEAGNALAEKLTATGVDCSGLIASPGIKTTTKVRILAGQSHSTRQQVIRIDYDDESIQDANLRSDLREQISRQSQGTDAIIISDYNYGVADDQLANFTREVAARRKIPVLADSRFRLSSFSGLTSATPNEDEVEHLLHEEFHSVNGLAGAAEKLRDQLGYRALLITRGSRGMMLLEEGVDPLEIEAVGEHEAVDVTGAGDTVMATYALALASDSSFPDAARLANYAGGLVVLKRGTATVSSEELENSILHT